MPSPTAAAMTNAGETPATMSGTPRPTPPMPAQTWAANASTCGRMSTEVDAAAAAAVTVTIAAETTSRVPIGRAGPTLMRAMMPTVASALAVEMTIVATAAVRSSRSAPRRL